MRLLTCTATSNIRIVGKHRDGVFHLLSVRDVSSMVLNIYSFLNLIIDREEWVVGKEREREAFID